MDNDYITPRLVIQTSENNILQNFVSWMFDTQDQDLITLDAQLNHNCFGIRAKFSEDPTKHMINRFTHFGINITSADLCYFVAESNIQQDIRKYLDQIYSFKPENKFQKLNTSDIFYIADIVHHNTYNPSGLTRTQRRRLKYIGRLMSKFPDLEIYYWESDKYEEF